MVGSGIPWYQMPRYVPLPPSGVKKPSSKTLLLEMRVSLPAKDEPKDRLSAVLVDVEGEARRVVARVRTAATATTTARRRRG